METIIIIVLGLAIIIFSIAILVRWWRMTNDIRDIRNQLCEHVEECNEQEI